MSRLRLREAIDGYICIAPWVLGFIIFTAFPIIASFVLSFSRYTILDPPRFIGLDNYTKMVSGDPLFWQSLKVTVIYTVLLVPLGTVGGYLLALLLNQAVKGVGFFRHCILPAGGYAGYRLLLSVCMDSQPGDRSGQQLSGQH